MKTFAVNSTVIFVTEVIFLGIYCTFFVMRHTRSQHLSMLFLRKKKGSRLVTISSKNNFFEKPECHLTAFAQIPVEPTQKHTFLLFSSVSWYPERKRKKREKKAHNNLWFSLFPFPEDFWISVLRNTCVYSLDIRWCQSFNCKTV